MVRGTANVTTRRYRLTTSATLASRTVLYRRYWTTWPNWLTPIKRPIGFFTDALPTAWSLSTVNRLTAYLARKSQAMILRQYQSDAITGLFNWWSTHSAITDIPIIVLPTGAGKSVVIAEQTRQLFA